MSRPRVVEVKRTLDGREQRFDCELVHHDARVTIVLFRLERDGQALRSYGLFWPRRPYNCYYAVPQAGGPSVFVRFDVLRDIEFSATSTPPEVWYCDLLLDLWVDSRGLRWEDEADVENARADGSLTPADARRIERARCVLERGHRRVTTEVRRTLEVLNEIEGAADD